MRPDPQFPGTKHWEILAGMVQEHGWKRGAEVGVLQGKTTRYLMETCPGLFLYAVDQWKHLPESSEEGAEHYQKYDMAARETLVRGLAKVYPGRLEILKGDSVLMAKNVTDGSLDFAFIDAAHTEPATRANIAAWLPKIRQGGWITGHDWNWPSVARALDAVLPGWVRHQESVWSLAL